MHIISFRSYKAITDGKQDETNTSVINPGDADSPLPVTDSWTRNHLLKPGRRGPWREEAS